MKIGAMVYVPNHEDEKSMFYLTVDNLILPLMILIRII